jgi:hypothetical protein
VEAPRRLAICSPPYFVKLIRPIFYALLIPPPFLVAQEAAPAPTAEHQHAAAGANDSKLLEGITPADFLRLGKEPQSVEVVLVAAFTGENYGMNFNGYAKGAAVYNIPKGWKVNVTFVNPTPIPHSVIVIDKDDTKKLQVAEPYFKGGAVEKHLQGVALTKQSFSFVPNESGSFALACGFPAHSANGHWVALQVSDSVKEPTLKLGEAEPKPASPAK